MIDATAPVISAASGVWFVVDLDTGVAWRKDAAEPIETDTLSGRVISRPSTSADAVYLADETRLKRKLEHREKKRKKLHEKLGLNHEEEVENWRRKSEKREKTPSSLRSAHWLTSLLQL